MKRVSILAERESGQAVITTLAGASIRNQVARGVHAQIRDKCLVNADHDQDSIACIDIRVPWDGQRPGLMTKAIEQYGGLGRADLICLHGFSEDASPRRIPGIWSHTFGSSDRQWPWGPIPEEDCAVTIAVLHPHRRSRRRRLLDAVRRHGEAGSVTFAIVPDWPPVAAGMEVKSNSREAVTEVMCIASEHVGTAVFVPNSRFDAEYTASGSQYRLFLDAAIESLATIFMPGYVCLDFADYREVLVNKRFAVMGSGYKGVGKPVNMAVSEALRSLPPVEKLSGRNASLFISCLFPSEGWELQDLYDTNDSTKLFYPLPEDSWTIADAHQSPQLANGTMIINLTVTCKEMPFEALG